MKGPMLFPWKRNSVNSHSAESSLVKLQTSSTMNYFNSTLDSSNQSNSKAVTMERLQALLELFWTPNLEMLFLDAEFCELSYEEQQAVINELMD